jgi:parvulin-like peptidyl-prolyl isomerase
MTTIVPVRQRALILGLLALLTLLAAGCGSGGGSGGKNAAVVAGEPIRAARVDVLMNAAQVAYGKNGQTFPDPGTSAYRALRDRALGYLVVAKELEQRAARQLGVRVTDAQVATAIATIKRRDFDNSDAKLADSIAAQGMTRAEFEQEQRLTLTRDDVAKKIASGATASTKEIQAYYDSHPNEFRQPKHREVREIRVEKVELARKLYAQLQTGADFATLVRKYSLDRTAVKTGGKFTIAERNGNIEVNRVGFSLRKGQISEPFATIHGWHILQALSDTTPAKTLPLAEVAPAIRKALGARNQQQKIARFVDSTTREYCLGHKVTYDKAFTPATDPCAGVH